ncbi:MAG: insulinase family protein [Candidatus Tumulicola sp.]
MNLRVIPAVLAACIAMTPATISAAPGDAASPTVENRNGTTIVRQPDARSSLVGIVLVVHAGLDRQTMKQNGLSALVAQTILRTPVTLPSKGEAATMPLEAAVAANGGSVRFTIDPGDVRLYVESLAADAPAVVALVRQALTAPDFSSATVRDARSALTHDLAQSAQHSRYALQVGLDMLSQASSAQANAGLPALGTATSLAQLVPADAAAFYRAYYRRGGAFVSAAGRLDALGADALASLADALPAGTTVPVTVRVPALLGSSREIVAHRDITSPWLIAQYPAPSVDSGDFGPMLVLSAFVRRTLAEIAQVPGAVSPTFASSAVGADYSYDRAPAHLVLYVNGAIGNPTREFATALSIVNVLAATRLQGSIDEFKAEAAGDFATGATTLETRAWLAAVFARGSASPDFLARALRAIAATTPEDVQRVARRYLGNPTIALVLPRDGSPQN